MKSVKTAEEYLSRHTEWKAVLEPLREILLATELEETIKWGVPTYTIEGKNVVGIGAFKSYAGLWFHQGALLKDEHNKLINAQEGVTKALRQWRFNSTEEIEKNLVRAYVDEAINNQKQGREIKPQKKKLSIPAELKERLKADRKLETSFNGLTPGKQKEYAEYVEAAKKGDTKIKRLEKITPMIKAGKGLNDKYKK